LTKVLELILRFASILTPESGLPLSKGHVLRFACAGDFLGLCFGMSGGFHDEGFIFLFVEVA
jgi:hypothetical protein